MKRLELWKRREQKICEFIKDKSSFWYFVGFLSGDGCISEDKRTENAQDTVRVLSTDIDLIERLYKKIDILDLHLSYTKPRKEGHRRQACLQIRSNFFSRILQRLGIPLQKSRVEWRMNEIEKGYEKSYLRGFIDADGCITRGGGRMNTFRIGMSSFSRLFLEDMKRRIEEDLYVCVLPSVRPDGKSWSLKISGLAAIKLFSICYGDEVDWDLKRKRFKGFTIINNIDFYSRKVA